MVDDDDAAPELVDVTQAQAASSVSHSAAVSGPAAASSPPLGETEPAVASSSSSSSPSTVPVPLLILTGFLGAGKTTLVSRLLSSFASAGSRIAIINNEAASAGVEPALVSSTSVMSFGTLLTLANGCICCSLTSDLVSALNHLLSLPAPSSGPLAYVVVECSGLASPQPLVQQLWVDEELGDRVYLDAVVCVVDGLHALQSLRGGEREQLVEQIVYSDRILINKRDRITADEERAVYDAVHSINSTAPIAVTQHSDIPLQQLLHLHAYDDSGLLPSLPSSSPQQHPHSHDWSIVNLTLQSERRVQIAKVKEWLAALLWQGIYSTVKEEEAEKAAQQAESSRQQVYRMKGAMRAEDGSLWYLQSVQRLFDLFPAAAEEPAEHPAAEVKGAKIVVIGRRLDQRSLQLAFDATLVS